MTARGKKRLFSLLRIAICVAALWFVLRGVTYYDHVFLADGDVELVGRVIEDGDPMTLRLRDGRTETVALADVAVDGDGNPRIVFGLASAWQSSKPVFLLLAVLLHLPVGVFQGIRLRWLLRAQEISLTYWGCVKLSFAGNFLNFATPLGSNAGDVFKAYFLTTHTKRKTEAATTIFLDRAIGLGTLLGCVGVITLISASDSMLAAFRPYTLTVLGAGFVGAFLYFSKTIRKYVWPHRLLEKLPAHNQLQRIDRTAQSLLDRKSILAAAVVFTLILQVLAIGAYFTVAVALSMDAHAGNVLEYYAYFYTGAVIQALPGPPQGLGTVELAYRYFLAPFGSPSQIVCMAFMIRVLVLTVALPGLVVTLTGSYRPRDVAVCEATSESVAVEPVR
ncbi:MAG: lysylphosphatidylglycerol synthase transmembrane domain-containing protein [Phycisphaerae bacterium]